MEPAMPAGGAADCEASSCKAWLSRVRYVSRGGSVGKEFQARISPCLETRASLVTVPPISKASIHGGEVVIRQGLPEAARSRSPCL